MTTSSRKSALDVSYALDEVLASEGVWHGARVSPMRLPTVSASSRRPPIWNAFRTC